MFRPVPFRALLGITLATAGTVLLCRLAGFGEGLLLGATPASGIALFAAVRYRLPGIVAAATGFALAALAYGFPLRLALCSATLHGLAALLAALVMRAIARRRAIWSRTSDWLIFAAGTMVFTVNMGLAAGLVAWTGLAATDQPPLLFGAMIAIFEPLGVITAFAVIASRGEWRAVRDQPGAAVVPLVLAVALLGLLGFILAQPSGHDHASGATLMASLPFCLWIAMQPRSLDGAVISCAGAYAALYMVLRSVGGITTPEYLTTMLYLNFLIIIAQFLHAVNRDRACALGRLAAHQAELENRVAERTARLSLMTERALAADAAKTRFLATVSHEVRTPLNGVIGMASVVLANPLDPATRANVEVIRSSGFHLLDVINRILDYSRLESGGAFEVPTDFDLGTLVEEVMTEARFLPRAKGVELRHDVPRGLALSRHGYRQGLRQVLTNLVGNGLKFTESGAVILRLRETAAERLRIEVEDSGIGVEPEARERIFQPFEQADATMTRRFGGTGLGLAISAEIITRMGGKIGVEGAGTGQGARFWIDFPLPLATEAAPMLSLPA